MEAVSIDHSGGDRKKDNMMTLMTIRVSDLSRFLPKTKLAQPLRTKKQI